MNRPDNHTSAHAPARSLAHEPFTVFPAIDLRAGRVVRLAQGDPSRQTVYGDNPAAVALRWQADGAAWVHVVNLDGAFGGADDAARLNLDSLAGIVATGLRVQFGGGLRSEADLRRVFELGAARAVLGTAAVEDPALVNWALETYGADRIAIGLDARQGRVTVRGWTQPAGVTAIELGTELRRAGIAWCIFTDVSRDGMRAGLNLSATAALADATGLRVIASGGVAGLSDVRAARQAGLAGVIVGRALYEGQVSLKEALGVSG
jgi:phosphoribosylformimino-5-aminoimidazole carboxamide ribotide isomerase